MIVEGIGDLHQRSQSRAQALLLPGIKRRHFHAEGFRSVGDQGGLTAGAADRCDATPGQRTHYGKELEGFEKLGERLHARDVQPLEHGVVERVDAYERAGVTERRAGAEVGVTHLERYQWNAAVMGGDGGLRETLHVVDALDMNTDGLDARIFDQRFDVIGDAERRLIAHRDHVAKRQ